MAFPTVKCGSETSIEQLQKRCIIHGYKEPLAMEDCFQDGLILLKSSDL